MAVSASVVEVLPGKPEFERAKPRAEIGLVPRPEAGGPTDDPTASQA